MRHGDTAEEDAVHHTEDGGIHSDAQRKSEHSHGGEARRFPQHAEGVAQILAERLEEPTETNSAHFFFDLLDAAEFDERLPPGF
jgi:hypothetical protein